MQTLVPNRARAQGFSLIEILIATLILSIAIIALADMFLWAIRKNGQSSQMSMANQIAQEKLEELFARDFANLAVSNTEACEFDWGTGAGNITIPVANCWQPGADPCLAHDTDTVTKITGYNREIPSGTVTPVRKIYDRCWWILEGPQNTTTEDQTRILRVIVRPRALDPTKGFIGKPIVADVSLIKAGNVGGAFTRN